MPKGDVITTQTIERVLIASCRADGKLRSEPIRARVEGVADGAALSIALD